MIILDFQTQLSVIHVIFQHELANYMYYRVMLTRSFRITLPIQPEIYKIYIKI